MTRAAAGQMSGSRRPAQTAQIESSCVSGTLVAQSAAKTRVGRHSWKVDIRRVEEGSDFGGVGEGVKPGVRARASCSCGYMGPLEGAEGAPGSEEREDTLDRATEPEYSRCDGLVHGLNGWDGRQRRVGMVDEASLGHRLHAGAAHEAPRGVCGSWVAAVEIRVRRKEARGVSREFWGLGSGAFLLYLLFFWLAAPLVLGREMYPVKATELIARRAA